MALTGGRVASLLSDKRVNMVMLIGGFGLGQGGLFLANSYLYWTDHLTLVAAFGTAHALLTLVYFFADWGGSTYLAKEALAAGSGEPGRTQRSYMALSLFRLVFGVACLAGFHVYFASVDAGFMGEYFKAAGFGLLFFAFNTAGLLDGQSKSGIAGLTQAVPIVLVSVALPFCAGLDLPSAGRLLGTLYSLGMAATIACQLLATQVAWRGARDGLRPRTVARVAVSAFSFMLLPLPGQLLFRGQVMLASAFFSTDLTALFLYCRQIVGIGYQLIGFYLRVDLKDFFARLRGGGVTPVGLLRSSTTVRLGLCMAALLLVAAAALSTVRPDLAGALAPFALCVAAIAGSAVLQRAYMLSDRAGTAFAVLVVSTGAGLATAWLLAPSLFVQALILGEFVSQALQIVLFAALWPWLPVNRGNA